MLFYIIFHSICLLFIDNYFFYFYFYFFFLKESSCGTFIKLKPSEDYELRE
jgi:hypothetical protein